MTRIMTAAAGIVVGLSLLAGTAGCSALSPIATRQSYNPSDGVTITSGSIVLDNALVLTADGETARLTGRITNTGSTTQTVTIEVRGEGTPARFSTSVASDASIAVPETAIIDSLGVQPGATVPIYLQAGSASGSQVETPVLNGDLEQYASLIPSPGASAPAASSSASASTE